MTKPDTARAALAVIFERIGPYHYARLRAAGQYGPIIAIECATRDTTYCWDPISGAESFERITLFRESESEKQNYHTLVTRLTATLRAVHPAVVAVPGWSHPLAIAALRWCVLNRTPAVLMSESTAFDSYRTNWREQIKERIVSLCSSGLVGGSAHADYLQTLGMPTERIFVGYDVVDNDYFAVGADSVRKMAGEMRRRLGLPRCFFLASGRLVEEKNMIRLLEAYARYRQYMGVTAWNLVLLGDGPLMSEVRRLRQRLGLERYVVLPGFKQYDKLPAYYGLAQAFVHASTKEPWGLVVNEAMAAGLPVIVSKHCGCARDLVVEGRNGLLFDPYDTESIAESMRKVSMGRGNRRLMGRTSREIVSDWGLTRFAAGLWNAAQLALKVNSDRASLTNKAVLWALGTFSQVKGS